MWLLVSLLVGSAHAQDLNKGCFQENKKRDCVRLGTALWQKPETREDALKAFDKGCKLGEESACTLKAMKIPAKVTPAIVAAPKEIPAAETPATEPPAASTSEAKAPAQKLEVKSLGKNTYAIKRSSALALTQDLDSTLDQARVEPNVVKRGGGKIEGYRIESLEPGSVYEALGFKTGDLILEVNDQMLTSPAVASSLLAQAAIRDTFVVRYQRGKQWLQRTFKLVD